MSGGITKISPNSIIAELYNWKLEAESSYNDGWIKKHYEDQLEEVFKQVDRMRMTKEDLEVESAKKEWVCDECGKSTYETEDDYLVHPKLHLGCALTQEKTVKVDDVSDFM